MIFISRPLSVSACMIPFKQYKRRDRIFLSLVGLKGAVPIIFAILCMSEGVEHSSMLFNVVFACTLVSLVVQGTTLSYVAKRLKLASPQEAEHKLLYFDIDLPEEIESSAWEKEVTEDLLAKGSALRELDIPDKTLVIMVRREDTFFVPNGDTQLQLGDMLLIISDKHAEKVVQEIEEEDELIFANWGLYLFHHTGSFVRDKWRKITGRE